MPHPSHSKKLHRFGKLLVPKHRNRVYLCPVSVDIKKEFLKKNRNRIKKKSYWAECPLSVDTHVPVDVSQIFTLVSLLPLATFVPSGDHATDKTLRFR